MKITIRRIASLLVITFMAQMLLGCYSRFTATPQYLSTPGQARPVGDVSGAQNSDYAYAQATIEAGQNQLSELSRRATQISWDMSQAADAAAQATREYNQRQKMDMDFQATQISQEMAQAAATMDAIQQQTRIAAEATALVQNNAATATQFAYLVQVTQTAQAQAIVDMKVMQTSQAAASLTAYPLTATYAAYEQNLTQTVQAQRILDIQARQAVEAQVTQTAYSLTATPLAKTQAALLMQQYAREQQSFVDQIVIPLIPFVVILVLALFILGIVLAYRRNILFPWPRRLRLTRGNEPPSTAMMIDGVIVDHDLQLHPIVPSELPPENASGLPAEDTVHVEIVEATEIPVAHWIAELEQQLTTEEEEEL